MAWMTTKRELGSGQATIFSHTGDSDWFAIEVDVAAGIEGSLDGAVFGSLRDRAGNNAQATLVAGDDPQILAAYPFLKVTVGPAGTVTFSERVNNPS